MENIFAHYVFDQRTGLLMSNVWEKPQSQDKMMNKRIIEKVWELERIRESYGENYGYSLTTQYGVYAQQYTSMWLTN